MQARQNLERELEKLKQQILSLSSQVDQRIGLVMDALLQRNLGLAQQIIYDDRIIDKQRYQIEDFCFQIIATQQPTASDLRAILAATALATELERIADHGSGIARLIIRMGEQPLLKPLVDIPRMATIAREMLRVVIDAYAARDDRLATEAISRDDAVDTLYNQVFRELLTFMLEDPRTITRAMSLIWIAHDLERIADRVTNMGERVIFMRTGKLEDLND